MLAPEKKMGGLPERTSCTWNGVLVFHVKMDHRSDTPISSAEAKYEMKHRFLTQGKRFMVSSSEFVEVISTKRTSADFSENID